MGITSAIYFLFSFIIALVLTPAIRNLALHTFPLSKVKIDVKEGKRIPHIGGLSVCVAFTTVFLWAILSHGFLSSQARGILAGIIIIVVVGLLDDCLELSPVAKFFGQMLAITCLVFFNLTTQMVHLSPIINILVTYFWCLSIINALNLLDIMDGLCSGVTFIALGTFLVMSFLSQNLFAVIVCSAMLGAVLGFLRYNFPSASIYLGDTGSMLCGFVLAAIAMIVDYAPLQREIALITPVLVLGLPLFDTAFVVLMRLLHKRPIAKKSRDHFALRLLSAGWQESKVLLLMYLFALFFSISALVISNVTNRLGILLLITISLICAMALKKMGAVTVDG